MTIHIAQISARHFQILAATRWLTRPTRPGGWCNPVGVVCPQSVRDPSGASIALYTAKLHHPNKTGNHVVLQALFYLLDRAVERWGRRFHRSTVWIQSHLWSIFNLYIMFLSHCIVRYIITCAQYHPHDSFYCSYCLVWAHYQYFFSPIVNTTGNPLYIPHYLTFHSVHCSSVYSVHATHSFTGHVQWFVTQVLHWTLAQPWKHVEKLHSLHSNAMKFIRS